MTATKTRPAPTANLLDRAWAAVPGLTDTAASLALVSERLRATMTTAPAVDDAAHAADLLARLDSGEGLPDDLGQGYLLVVQQRQAHTAERGLLTTMAAELGDRRRRLRGTGADDALRVLAAELDELLEQARPVLDRLGPVRDAEGAMTAGGTAVDDLRQARALVARHEAVRAAQGQILTWALDPPDSATRDAVVTPRVLREQVATFGSLRNYRDLQPAGDGREQLVTRKGTDAHGHAYSETLRVDRPSDAPAPWPTSDALADLRFLAGPAAQPWVPTVAEFQQACEPPPVVEAATPKPRSLQITEQRARKISSRLPAMSTTPAYVEPEF